ncbi:tartrate transporter [Enterobacter cancerogenus]|uniref:Tartrate transporter n=1 Tax=Enterobacter cancerogenus TaxID=69218 RepID=A0A484ZA22_9ENTR|nr:tartrate transporter [Enterobacter cancerogenus]
MTTSSLQDKQAVEHRVINKLFRRLIVFLFILFCLFVP